MTGVKYDAGKPRWGLLPWRELEDVVKVLTIGSQKYADENWKIVDGARERYYDAMLRHIAEYRIAKETYNDQRKYDPETGLNHLAHAMCNMLFLSWFDNQVYTEEPKQVVTEEDKRFLAKKLAELEDVAEIQLQDGNWNYNEYQFGIANGLITAMSILADKDIEFLERPDFWTKDIKIKEPESLGTFEPMKAVGVLDDTEVVNPSIGERGYDHGIPSDS